MKLFDLKQRQQAHLTAAREAAANGNDHSYGVEMSAASRLDREIATLEKDNTIKRMTKDGMLITGGTADPAGRPTRKFLSAEYASDFFTMIKTKGSVIGPNLAEGGDGYGGFALPGFTRPSAALYEGSAGAGGYAVPITVDDQIVPLAPQEMAVRRLAQVFATSNDIKFPVKAAFGTATAKAETSAFTESDLTLSQFTLSAFMAGIQENISWELAQDVPAFQATVVDDMILAQQMYEENLYINGTGSGQAQGLIGNVGAGVTEEPDASGNLVSIQGILDLIGTLNSVYHENASFLMSRATSIIIRKAQMVSNLFYPAFTRDANGQDRLFGYPVQYASAMPTAARTHAPVLFGDFKRGYLIGDRGGSGINVKVLDQPLATQGLIVLLAYRRTDGRVRRSEAIQQYNVATT